MFVVVKARKKGYAYVRAIYATITVTSWVCVYTATYELNLGAVPLQMYPLNGADDPNKIFYISFDFYNKIFMQPWYWVGVYCFGTLFGGLFQFYLKYKDQCDDAPIKTLNGIRNTAWKRALCYGFGSFFVLGGYFRQKRFVEKPEENSRVMSSVWATLGNTGFSLGVALFVLLMLLNRARPLAALFNGEVWTAPSKITAAFNLMGPLVALWYFMSTSTSLNYEFLPQLYYFFGNLVFTVILALVVGTISDFPVQMLYRMLFRPAQIMSEDERATLKESFLPAHERINNTTVVRSTENSVIKDSARFTTFNNGQEEPSFNNG